MKAMESPLTIEELTPERFEEKAAVHSLTWHETYEGMLPDEFVSLVTPEFALRVTKRHDPRYTLVAVRHDAIVGFVEYLPQTGEELVTPHASEIGALYVLRSAQHEGVGTRLIDAALSMMPEPYAALTVFTGNAHAIGFYKHMGFRSTGHIIPDDFDTQSLEMTNGPLGLQHGHDRSRTASQV